MEDNDALNQEQEQIHPTVYARLQPELRRQITVDVVRSLEPQAQQILQRPITNWNISKWQCCLRPCPCICSLLVPYCCCFIQAKNAIKINEGGGNELTSGSIAFLNGILGCCIGCAVNRKQVRKYYGINGSFCNDLLSWMFCPCGAAMQEHNEVHNESWTKQLLKNIKLADVVEMILR